MLDWIPFISSYPVWVRYLVLAWLALSVVIVGGVLLMVPRTTSEYAQPSITFERVTIFYVAVSSDTYQIGIIMRLFNKDNTPHLLTGVNTDPLLFQLRGAGSAIIQKLFITGITGSNDEDLAIRPSDYRDIKILLPIKWLAKLQGSPPEIIFISPLSLEFKDIVERLNGVKPDFYGNFVRPVSEAEWGNLLKQSSSINIGDVSYKRTPANSNEIGQTKDYIIYNPDSSAKIDVYGFDRTNYQKGDKGVVVMLKGNGIPVLDGGWMLMAHNYSELQRDPKMLLLYNSIYPPDENGLPKSLDAGFRGADLITFGPFTKDKLPIMCDFTSNPPVCTRMGSLN